MPRRFITILELLKIKKYTMKFGEGKEKIPGPQYIYFLGRIDGDMSLEDFICPPFNKEKFK